MSQLEFISKELIDKGWSCDKKYCVTTPDGTKYLLRITPESKSAGIRDMFRMQQKAAALGVPMCKPVETGRILKKIHAIPAPENQQNWEERFNAKIDKKINMYNECSIQFDGADKIIDYINANRILLANRPQVFQHGDYHIGNMMIENGKIVGDKEIDTMLKQAKDVLAWYDNMQNPVPTWYFRNFSLMRILMR